MAVLGTQHQTQGAHQQGGSHRIYGKGTTDSFVEDMMKKDFCHKLKKKGEARMGDGDWGGLRMSGPPLVVRRQTYQPSNRQARGNLGQDPKTELGVSDIRGLRTEELVQVCTGDR